LKNAAINWDCAAHGYPSCLLGDKFFHLLVSGLEEGLRLVVKPVPKCNNRANRAELQELITELPTEKLIEVLNNKTMKVYTIVRIEDPATVTVIKETIKLRTKK